MRCGTTVLSTPNAMASATKRQKIVHSIKDEDAKLETFLNWCRDVDLVVNDKVRVGKEGSCRQYGMVAIDDVKEGETLFSIPRGILLHPESCSIRSLLKKGETELRSESGWVPLLLCLMFEYVKPDSRWRPYLDLCPDSGQLDQPMFWDRDMVTRELQGTNIPDMVAKDLESVQHEYQTVAMPFMEKNPEYFDLNLHNFQLYQKMVAFVLAYSFTEPPKKLHRNLGSSVSDEDEDSDSDEESGGEALLPMMVPVADILNHVAKNNARLQFSEKRLNMVATRNIKKNEEVYNTYGELPNWQLLQMYGFAEPYPDNIYDTVEIPSVILRTRSEEIDGNPAFTQAKWNFLTEELELEACDKNIVTGRSGILNMWETYHMIKYLSMTPAEFEKCQTHLEEQDDDKILENLDEYFSFQGLSQLPIQWKQFLRDCANTHMKSFKNTLETDSKLWEDCQITQRLNSRERYALHVRIGQQKLLERLTQTVGMNRSEIA